MLSRGSMREATRKKYVQSEVDRFTTNDSLPCKQGEELVPSMIFALAIVANFFWTAVSEGRNDARKN